MTEWLHVRFMVNAALSVRRPERSGVPQELGQVLLNIFVSNSSSQWSKHSLSTSADSTAPCEVMPSRGPGHT